ncbi:MAG: FecR family protein [Luminiphilus sp.]
MSNIREFPSGEDRRLQEAGDWIAAIERGLTKEEESELDSWLSRSTANYQLFMELAQLWDNMEVLNRLSDLFPEPQSEERYPSNRVLSVSAVAASVVVGILLFVTLQTQGIRNPALQDNVLVANELSYDTAIGDHATFELSDGSIISLNTNSHVRVNYTASERLLMLDRGEVHVKVAHDSDRPLSVAVGNKVVRAVGTEFNVEITQDASIELVVTDGVVMVGVLDASDEGASSDTPKLLPQSSTIVGAGEQVLISANGQNTDSIKPESIERDEIAVKLSWREGNLIFRGESLEEAVYEVGRYTAVEFVFLDEETREVRVAGLFKAGDVEGLLAALRNHFNIAYERQGEHRILLGTAEERTDS